jgi:hypothetical protein
MRAHVQAVPRQEPRRVVDPPRLVLVGAEEVVVSTHCALGASLCGPRHKAAFGVEVA